MYSCFPTLEVLLYMQVMDFVSKSVACTRMKISQDNVSFCPSKPVFGGLAFVKVFFETVFVFEMHSWEGKTALSKTQNISVWLQQVAEVDAGLC